MKTALVTGADRGFGYCITKELMAKGYVVFAGRYNDEYPLLDKLAAEQPGKVFPIILDVGSEASVKAAVEEVLKNTDHLDVYVSNAAYMMGPPSSQLRGELPIDESLLDYSVRINSLGAFMVFKEFLPLFDRGTEKRLCFLSSEVSSITMMRRDDEIRYCITKSALNIMVRMLYNKLYDDGYTFRLYQPGWMRRMLPDGTKDPGLPQQIEPEDSAAFAIDIFTGRRGDEQRLVLVDHMGNEWPY